MTPIILICTLCCDKTTTLQYRTIHREGATQSFTVFQHMSASSTEFHCAPYQLEMVLITYDSEKMQTRVVRACAKS